jgi:hypothetical protein
MPSSSRPVTDCGLKAVPLDPSPSPDVDGIRLLWDGAEVRVSSLRAGEGRTIFAEDANTPARVLSRAGCLVGDFEQRLGEFRTYEKDGILFSEMLFVFAVLAPRGPSRIVESGRARGQSTSLLARCFPDSRILSVDLDASSPDAVFGERRLRDYHNVELLNGDAKDLLSDLVSEGDALIIDGPKSFRALHLALHLLGLRRPSFVFLHDFYQGQSERSLLERLIPEACFSDHPDFVNRFRYLDDPCWEMIEAERPKGWAPYTYAGVPQRSYGPTYACIPHEQGEDYEKAARVVIEEGFLERARFLLEQRRKKPRD